MKADANHIQIIDLSKFQANRGLAEILSREATIIETVHGNNAYTAYLRRYGQRPPPETAAAIGRLIGARVKASDGSMQPRRTLRERAERRQALTRYRRDKIVRLLRRTIKLMDEVTILEEHPAEAAKQLTEATTHDAIESLALVLGWWHRFAQELQTDVERKDSQFERRATLAAE